jgi:hypothetical protein
MYSPNAANRQDAQQFCAEGREDVHRCCRRLYVSSMSKVGPYITADQKLAFARELLRGRAKSFKKDIDICLTRNASGSHAYFPALSTCISFLDFLSGLYAGRVHGHGFQEFISYAASFLDNRKYGAEELEILYEGFRHKIAHLGHPYSVFDTDTSRRLKGRRKKRLVTWTVYAGRRRRPLELIEYPTMQQVQRSLAPWTVPYDSRLLIGVRCFASDICQTVRGHTGFIKRLETDQSLMSNFSNCLQFLYPK